MPLRDHFRPPLGDYWRRNAVQAMWPTLLTCDLNKRLSQRYVASPCIRTGSPSQIDVATMRDDGPQPSASNADVGEGGVATGVWAPPAPTMTVATERPEETEYEVQIYDEHLGQIVAAVEIVSLSNKDRPETREAFVAKCAALLRREVAVSIVDLVTTTHFNLYGELLELLGQSDPALSPDAPSTYAVSCRWRPTPGTWRFETWAYPMAVGRALPTLPLWLSPDLAVPLELEATYEETCRGLRIA